MTPSIVMKTVMMIKITATRALLIICLIMMITIMI